MVAHCQIQQARQPSGLFQPALCCSAEATYDNGELLDGGADLNAGGIPGYLQDGIWVTVAVQFLTAVISDWFWFLYLLVSNSSQDGTMWISVSFASWLGRPASRMCACSTSQGVDAGCGPAVLQPVTFAIWKVGGFLWPMLMPSHSQVGLCCLSCVSV